MKVQAHNSLEPSLEYNQDQMLLMHQGLLCGSYRNVQFQIILEGKTGKEIPESSILEF